MLESSEITCPHCGANFLTVIDLTEGDHETVIDCEVCCRPMLLRIAVQEGEIVGIETSVQ